MAHCGQAKHHRILIQARIHRPGNGWMGSELSQQQAQPRRLRPACPTSATRSIDHPQKEITMLNPLRLASHAAGACALALAFLSPAQAAPVLEMSTVASATGIELTVSARDVVDLYGYQFTLNFDPALLRAVAGTEGAFLQSTGATTFFDAGSIDNLGGSVSFVFGGLIGPLAGVDGSGDLATFSFNVQHSGLASFSFSDLGFLDSNLADIAIEARELSAEVTAVPEPGSLFLAATGLFALLGGRAIKPRAR
jgi:hypothetical protein